MSDPLVRRSIGDQVHFSSISDPKFKHNRLSVNFVMPLSRETASDNAIVPYLLRKGSRECPDFSSLNGRLAELYGAILDAGVTKYADYQVMEVSIQALDNRFALEGEDITGQCAKLLASLVLDPNFDGKGLFLEKDVALEKQFVLDSIEAEINEKRPYALSRCVQIMCQGEPVAVRRYGDTETAEQISVQSATDAYHRILDTAAVEIMFTGSGNPESAYGVFAEKFSGKTRNPLQYRKLQLRDHAQHVREHVERMDLNQAKMVMGMRTGNMETLEQVSAGRVFSALFGGTPFSKLFLNVREKLSLCYYCASRFDVSTKLLLVDSGVEFENIEKAREEILRQLQSVQNGEFDDQDLHNTKLLLKNSITKTGDSPAAMEGWYMTQILRSQNISPQQDSEMIDAVTRDQVIRAAKGVTLDTVYLLTGNQDQDKEGA